MNKVLTKSKAFFIWIFLVVSVFGLSSCVPKNAPKLDPSTFDNFASNIFLMVMGGDEMSSNYLFEHPEDFGLERYEPGLPTPPSGSSVAGTALINLYFSPLYRYEYEELSFDQQMTYLVIEDLLCYINETIGMDYLKADYLGSYLGYQAQLPILLVQYNLKDDLDIQNYFKYLELIPETFQKYVDFEIKKAENGYGMPNFVIDKVINQCQSFIDEVNNITNTHFMIEMFNNKIDSLPFLTDSTKVTYKEYNSSLVHGAVVDGYAYVRNNLKAVYDKAENEMGLAHYLNSNGAEIGKAYYEALFKRTTGYDMPITEAIEYLQVKIDTKLAEYLSMYQADQSINERANNIQLMNTTPEEQLSFYQDVMYSHFPTLDIPAMPNTNVLYVDKSMEDHFSPAAYMTSAVDNFSDEYIYLNNKSIYTTDEEGDAVLDYNYLYTTLAHEGFPGHMYQNIYFKNTESNIIRKVLKNSGYIEGWATYAELYSYNFLADTYDADVLKFLRLNDEINGMLTARLDLGIHYEGWTMAEAEEYLGKYIATYNKDNPNYNEGAITKIYQQLVEIPTNSQKYYFTYLKLEDMYEYAKQASGNDFDPIAFHQIILNCGPVPLRFIEEIIEEQYSKKA